MLTRKLYLLNGCGDPYYYGTALTIELGRALGKLDPWNCFQNNRVKQILLVVFGYDILVATSDSAM